MTRLHGRFQQFHQIHLAARIRTLGTREEAIADIPGYHAGNFKNGESMFPIDQTRSTTAGDSSQDCEKEIWEFVIEDPRGLDGMGDRLLHLLQRWDIENLILILGQRDASLSCRLMSGFEIYRQGLECAKHTLEEYLVAQMNTVDTAKLEIIETPRSEMKDDTSQELPRKIVRPPAAKLRVKSDEGKYTKPSPIKTSIFVHPNAKVEDSKGGLSDADRITEWIGITSAEWVELQSTQQYTKELHLLLMCLVCVADRSITLDTITTKKLTNTMSNSSKLLDQDVPDSLKWIPCLKVLHQIYRDTSPVQKLHGSKLNSTQEQFLRAIFQLSHFDEKNMRSVSSACVKVYKWLEKLMIQYDERIMSFVETEHKPKKEDVFKQPQRMNRPIINRVKSPEGKLGQIGKSSSVTAYPAGEKDPNESVLLPVSQLQQSQVQQPRIASIDLDESMAVKVSRSLMINDSGRLLKR
uniref:Uncharacterized protein AlNc14C26G2534 n=1 Tax=Albugo laibachii Nc14 TaxID=890382 RepID=F0W6P8_9STRA|nr:conserved hypothetical protein [Albugo laibachii Nc14]|eukprot:CCA16793.1 conserved hypothetical protein [Albugo laibachii Nc14]